MCDKSDRKTMICPLFKELCTGGRTKSMREFDNAQTGEQYTCRLWSRVRGKCPQCQEAMDWGDCSYYWAHIVGLENAQMTRHVIAQVSEHTKAFVDALPDSAQKQVLNRASTGLIKTLMAESVEKLMGPPPQAPSKAPQIEEPKQ